MQFLLMENPDKKEITSLICIGYKKHTDELLNTQLPSV